MCSLRGVRPSLGGLRSTFNSRADRLTAFTRVPHPPSCGRLPWLHSARVNFTPAARVDKLPGWRRRQEVRPSSRPGRCGSSGSTEARRPAGGEAGIT